MTTPVDAVTFDFWNTLVYEERGHLRDRRLSAWLGVLEDAGFAAERQLVEVAFDHAWDRYVEAWIANRQYQAAEAAEAILERLGYDVPPDVRRQLLDAFRSAGYEAELLLAPNVDECLRALKRADVRVGIVCDVGMTPSSALRTHLKRHGLLELFDHWSFSDEVGVYKPDRRIFEHALAGLGGVAPARAAHVGDLRRTDVAGANDMGMVSVRYTGVFDDPGEAGLPEATHVVSDHAELPAVLGLA
ncbi:MAG: HAD family hydrolase [Acidimicrobiales bacterium]